jgi:UDP-N-acetylglucosamine 1-carboxyvinyltransferase
LARFEITGGKSLCGTIVNQGAKNAALPIIVASLLAEDEVVLENVPQVEDIKNIAKVLRATGASVHCGEVMRIKTDGLSKPEISVDAARKIRSSLLLPAALLSRFSVAQIPIPGGDSIGSRKIDVYVEGLNKLGAEFNETEDFIFAKTSQLRGAEINLNMPSVTGTEGLMIAATLAEGKTIIHNVAREPEIVDLAVFLNSMGARVTGAGTSSIKIEGVKKLHGTRHRVIPDRMAAGTFIVASAITKGDLLIENVNPLHIKAFTDKLQKAGVKISTFDNSVRVECLCSLLKSKDVTTRVYPGFPTDMQPIFMALMTLANGTSKIKETLYDGRFTHVADLVRMGAKVGINKETAIIRGVKSLRCAKVRARDIRGGAALVMAALAAEGTTEVYDVYQIDRGYYLFEESLRQAGAIIERVEE